MTQINSDELTKVLTEYIEFVEKSLQTLRILSGGPTTDMKPILDFFNAQKDLFVKHATGGK